MYKMREVFLKNKTFIMYAFFGVCTTLVNWITYYLCYNIINFSNVFSTILAWILAVGFAFITNKLWVFNSKSFGFNVIIRELYEFIAARLITGLLDLVIMYITVDILHFNPTFWKLVSNGVVIIINYIFSKLVIFKRNDKE